MSEQKWNIFTILVNGEQERELLLPADEVKAAAVSPDGFDLAVATDAGVFVLDALDTDPPEIVLHPLPARLAVGALAGAEDANLRDPAELTTCCFETDGRLRLTDRYGDEHVLDLRVAALQQLMQPAVKGGLWRIGRPVSDLVCEGYRKGCRMSKEDWDYEVDWLLTFGEESAYESIRDRRCPTYEDCDAHCDSCDNTEVTKHIVKRIMADINFVLQRLPVNFTAEEEENYPAPALRVTFRHGTEKTEMLVAPHIADSVEKLREVFKTEEPYWMHREEPFRIYWAEYDMDKPYFDYKGNLADSCFKDPYCDKPTLDHYWTFKFTHGQMLGVTLKSDRLPEPYYGEFMYRDFRFAVLAGLGIWSVWSLANE